MKFEELMQKEYQNGIQQGIQQAETRMQRLIQCMQEAGEQELLARLSEADFLEAMYRKYNV